MGKHSGGSAGTIVPRPVHRGGHRGRSCFSVAVPAIMIFVLMLVVAL